MNKKAAAGILIFIMISVTGAWNVRAAGMGGLGQESSMNIHDGQEASDAGQTSGEPAGQTELDDPVKRTGTGKADGAAERAETDGADGAAERAGTGGADSLAERADKGGADSLAERAETDGADGLAERADKGGADGLAERTGMGQADGWAETDGLDIESQAEDLLSDLGLSEIDAYMSQEDYGGFTFSGLVKELMSSGLSLDFASAGEKLKQAVRKDYAENRSVLIQVLILAIAFSVVMQMTSALQKNYIPDLGFLGIYLIVMMLLLRLFLIVEGTAESYLSKLTEFMQLLQPVFCMSMVFSNGSISAGAYYQLLLLLIFLIDLVFVKILLPAVQIYMVLQLLNHLAQERFSRIAELLSDGVNWCVKITMTALIGLNIVQGLLAPGIDGLKRSTIAGAVRVVPGAGQIMNSMTEMLAGSAMLVKNSVGVAALVILVAVSFLPLVKAAVFMLLYRGCAALMEPVSDKRFCAAVAALGQSAALCLKLMFYAALLFFLTTAVICASTTLAKSV